MRVGGARPPPLITFTITSKVSVYASWVGRHTNPVSSLGKYVLCALDIRNCANLPVLRLRISAAKQHSWSKCANSWANSAVFITSCKELYILWRSLIGGAQAHKAQYFPLLCLVCKFANSLKNRGVLEKAQSFGKILKFWKKCEFYKKCKIFRKAPSLR